MAAAWLDLRDVAVGGRQSASHFRCGHSAGACGHVSKSTELQVVATHDCPFGGCFSVRHEMSAYVGGPRGQAQDLERPGANEIAHLPAEKHLSAAGQRLAELEGELKEQTAEVTRLTGGVSVLSLGQRRNTGRS